MSSAVIEYSLIVDTEKGTSKIRKVGNALNDIGDKGQKAGKKAGNALEGIGGKLIMLNQGIELASKAFRALGGPISKIVDVGAKFETLHLQLNKVLGSAQKGKEYFSWLKEFSTSTPFKMEGLAESVIMLENFGINAKKNLTTLGDTASALSIPLKDLSLIMGKIYKKPKASMEEMLQLIEKGVPVFDILQEKLGLTAEQVGDIGRAGISGKKAFDALLSGMTEKYGGSMKDLSKTWSGLMSTLSDWWDQFLNKIAESGVLDSLKSRLEGIIQKLEAWSKDGSLEKFAKGIGDAITGIINGISSVIKFFIEWKDVIVFAGKAWLTYFAINKTKMIFENFMTGVANMGGGLKGLVGSLKNVGAAMVVAFTVNKVVQVINVVGDLIEENRKLELSKKNAMDSLFAYYDRLKLQVTDVYILMKKQGVSYKEAHKLANEMHFALQKAFNSKGDANDRINALIDVVKRFKREQFGKTVAENWELASKASLAGSKDIIKYTKKISDQKAWSKLSKEAKLYVNVMLNGFSAFEPAITKNTKLTKEQIAAIKEQKRAYENLADTMGVLTSNGFAKLRKETNLLHRIWDGNKTQILNNASASEKWIQKIEEIKKAYSKIGKDVPEWLNNVEKAINKENSKIVEQTLAIKQSTDAFEDMFKQGIIPGIENFEDLSDKTKAWNDNLKETNKELKKILDDIGSVMNNAINGLSKLGIISSDTADKLGGIANAGLDLVEAFATGDTVDKINAVINAVVQVGEAVKEFLFGDGIQEAIDRENSWMNIAEELNDKLHELADELGDTHLATSKMLKDLMNGNVTYQNFGEWVERTREILADFDRGMLSSNETANLIGENFNYLIQQADELGIAGGKAMIELMDDLKNRGIEVKEVTEYIAKMNKEGLADYKLMKSALEEGNLQEEINKLHNSLANMKLGSAEYEETYNKLKELELKLGDIKNAQEIFGDVSIAVYDEMIAYEKKVAENSALENAIKGYAGAMIRLSATTKLTEDQYQSFEDTAASAYDKLIAQGYTSEQATKSMVPMLKQLAYLQQQFGYEIDDSTQAMIDQAIEQGAMSGDFRTDTQRMVDALERLVELMEKGLGGAIDNATRGFGKLGDKVLDIGRKWNKLDFKDIKIGENLNFSKIPHFAEGGNFTVPPGFENDTFPMFVSSGEHVSVTPANQTTNNTNNKTENIINQNLTFHIVNNSGDDIVERLIFAYRNNEKNIRGEFKSA